MLSAKQLIQQRSKAEGRTFLKYSDVPFGTNQVRVHVKDVRDTPKLNSPAVLDIHPQIEVDGTPAVTQKTSVPLNLTNLQALAGCLQTDDITAVRGMDVIFGFSSKYNPREDEDTMGLDLLGVEIHATPPGPAPAEAAATRK